MRISRTRSFRVELGNYEKADVSVSVTVDHFDLGYTDDEWRSVMADGGEAADRAEDELENLCLAMIDERMKKELASLEELADAKSFLYKNSRPSRRRER